MIYASCWTGEDQTKEALLRQMDADDAMPKPADVKSAERKATPVFSGFLAYFPDAVNAVAQLSAQANEKHNPGEPLHWSKHKSNDHADCLVRHQMEVGVIDPDTGFDHAVAVAWRAMAQLQIMLEDKE